MHQVLKAGWQILQDVYDEGETLGLYREDFSCKRIDTQLSEWENLEKLVHLQLLYADSPYYSRQLRYFNQAPWWYRNQFAFHDAEPEVILHFTNVDYYCKVWLNGQYLGFHEGYNVAFSFDVSKIIRREAINTLIVKVWSPWETEIKDGCHNRRTYDVIRHMVKGTYEHDDTFIQRDVNPIGIYGSVYVETSTGIALDEKPSLCYQLDLVTRCAEVTLKGRVRGADAYTVLLTICDADTGEKVLDVQTSSRCETYRISGRTEPVRLWETWDHGGAHLYRLKLTLRDLHNSVSYTETIGFRSVSLERTSEHTVFYLNGRRFYVRGTSYFPDVYVSNMTEERYREHLKRIREAGFNLIRVHVHTEQDQFYRLCSEEGLAIMQDSEYNWMAPSEEDYENRLIRIFRQTVQRIGNEPSIICWICLNEPGFGDPLGAQCRMMAVSPGPALYKAAVDCAPNAAVIKGSFYPDDPLSGDSHNYAGSITAGNTHYTDIYGTSEKLNTEYGFDAPPSEEVLRRDPRIWNRLKNVVPRIPELQQYQYALLKYYTEHYRLQKYNPNSGYVQFLFSDICPQSFYGLYDYYGNPKKGLLAMQESGQPIGIFLEYCQTAERIAVVNDLYQDLGECTASWVFKDETGKELLTGDKRIMVPADSCITVAQLHGWYHEGIVDVVLTLSGHSGKTVQNSYHDLFHFPPHPAGHPETMNHEFGMRLYETEEPMVAAISMHADDK